MQFCNFSIVKAEFFQNFVSVLAKYRSCFFYAARSFGEFNRYTGDLHLAGSRMFNFYNHLTEVNLRVVYNLINGVDRCARNSCCFQFFQPMFNGIGYKYCIKNFFQCRFIVSSVSIGNKARIFNEFRFIKDSNGVMEGWRFPSGVGFTPFTK